MGGVSDKFWRWVYTNKFGAEEAERLLAMSPELRSMREAALIRYGPYKVDQKINESLLVELKEDAVRQLTAKNKLQARLAEAEAKVQTLEKRLSIASDDKTRAALTEELEAAIRERDHVRPLYEQAVANSEQAKTDTRASEVAVRMFGAKEVRPLEADEQAMIAEMEPMLQEAWTHWVEAHPEDSGSLLELYAAEYAQAVFRDDAEAMGRIQKSVADSPRITSERVDEVLELYAGIGKMFRERLHPTPLPVEGSDETQEPGTRGSG